MVTKTSTEIAEQGLIGCILLDAGKVMPEAMLRLDKTDFETLAYRVIFGECQALYRECKDVAFISLTQRMGTDIRPEMQQILLQAAESIITTADYRAYIDTIQTNAMFRRAKAACEAARDALDSEADLGVCQSKAADLLKCFSTKDMAESVTPGQGYDAFKRRMQKPQEYITTGLERIDRKTYISKGDYIIVAGRPSSGKTALTLQMMLHMARRSKVVYFSLETSPEKIFDRLMANYTGVELGSIKRRDLTDSDWQRIDRAKADFDKMQFSVVQAAGWTVDQIKSQALRERAEIIFVDYLGLIRGEGKSRYEQITQISVDLHIMAQQLGITVIALAQLNRANTQRSDKRPSMADLRDSGQIEQDADIILLLHTVEDTDDEHRELIAEKNKEGSTGVLRLEFNGPRQRFYEQDTRY